MKKYILAVLFIVLTACIAENYDVGHPIATIKQIDHLI